MSDIEERSICCGQCRLLHGRLLVFSPNCNAELVCSWRPLCM